MIDGVGAARPRNDNDGRRRPDVAWFRIENDPI